MKDFTLVAVASRPIPTTLMDEEEETIVPTDELDRYFLSASIDSTSSPISSHLEVVHEHFSGTFPIDLTVLAHLQKSLLKVTKSASPSIAPEVKETC